MRHVRRVEPLSSWLLRYVPRPSRAQMILDSHDIPEACRAPPSPPLKPPHYPSWALVASTSWRPEYLTASLFKLPNLCSYDILEACFIGGEEEEGGLLAKEGLKNTMQLVGTCPGGGSFMQQAAVLL